MDSSSLSVQDMTTYLKNVMETESSLFRQKMVRQQAQSCLQFKKPKKKEIKKPQMKLVYEPIFPKEERTSNATIGWFSVLGVLFVLLAFFSFPLGGFDGFVAGICCLWFGGMFIYGAKKTVDGNEQLDEKEQQYYRDRKKYEEDVVRAKEDYEQAKSAYLKEMEVEVQRYNLALRAAHECYQTAVEQVGQLDKPIAETEAVLQNLYDMGIIFPKYCNFAAVCMFYEYFVSGRCSELQGPNGAYNMYEAELRQNLIINKLDTILGSLEGIRENQFVLYTEVKKTTDALPKITRDVTGMLDTTRNISQSATIAAQCAEATKVNTEALKYLALIKH